MSGAPAPLLELFARLKAEAAGESAAAAGRPPPIPVEHYYDPARWSAEREQVFDTLPLMLAHASELPEPGSVLANDVTGRPILLSRDEDGQVHAHLNVCRHRGMRLIDEDGPCTRRSVVCPYHGWSYRLDGALKAVPHAEFFPDLDYAAHGLTALPCAEAHGLIWVRPTPGPALDMAAWLGPLGTELEYFGSRDFVLYRRSETVNAANWKLVIDAFLEAYHVRVLHRDTIYRFFLDAVAVADFVGPHSRSLVARRKLVEAPDDPAGVDFREHCSATHFVFPNLVTVNHPDYSSIMTVFPESPETLRWVHHMLVPRGRDSAEDRAHWEKTYGLIEGGVFQAEDLHAAESIQRGLKSGANREVTLGTMEASMARFHAMLARMQEGRSLPAAG